MSDIKQFCDRYYDAWNRKDLNAILACIDPGVVFKSPNATTNGRDAFTGPDGAMADRRGIGVALPQSRAAGRIR